MQILFDCFKYTDEFYERMQVLGSNPNEMDVNLSKDCYLEKILINVQTVKCARPSEGGKFTEVCTDGQTYYIINVPFNDYLQIAPHNKYAQMKSKWAN